MIGNCYTILGEQNKKKGAGIGACMGESINLVVYFSKRAAKLITFWRDTKVNLQLGEWCTYIEYTHTKPVHGDKNSTRIIKI